MSLSIVESLYRGKVESELKEKLQTKVPPRLVKIVLNMGVGKAASNKKYLETAVETMKLISGRQPMITKVAQSEAKFGIRAGWPIGCKVTLRRQGMFEFLDRLLHVAIPRIPDFSGLNINSFDKNGNYSAGFDCSIFPEFDIEQERIGMDVTIVTSARNPQDARLLLSLLEFPFKNKN
jgi:large subunit ribosomal protein L5